jgi:hypothetical protein
MRLIKAYNKSVFINFPFDSEYAELVRAVTFTIADCGFEPRCALERQNSGEDRIQKIEQLIEESKFGIHDISCTQLDVGHGFPRFNMPFELGLFFGAKRYSGNKNQKIKQCLVFEKNKNDYDKYISDISGKDIEYHNMKGDKVIEKTRDWLSGFTHKLTPGSKFILKRYKDFLLEFHYVAEKLGWDHYSQLKYVDFLKAINMWQDGHPIDVAVLTAF